MLSVIVLGTAPIESVDLLDELSPEREPDRELEGHG
jgi:hypothetical protein